MKEIKFDIKNYNSNLSIEGNDIICTEELQYTDQVIACSLVIAEITENLTSYYVTIKFEWLEEAYNLNIDDFLFIPESNVLFFRSTYQWGAIDLKNKALKRREYANCCPSLYKEDRFVLIIDELYAESATFHGNKIDNVPIDPPWEMETYHDRIEFISIVFGHQILKII